jgi:hypothetical protein
LFTDRSAAFQPKATPRVETDLDAALAIQHSNGRTSAGALTLPVQPSRYREEDTMAMKLLRPAQVEGGAPGTEARLSDDEARGLAPAARSGDIRGRNQVRVRSSRRDLKDDADFVTEWDPRLG